MGIAELNLDLTDEQKALRDSSRKFFMEVWRPASIALDKMPRPEDVVAKGSIFWDVLKKTYELGYQRMAFPQLVGGMELDPMSVALVTEAMGYASPGLAVAWRMASSRHISFRVAMRRVRVLCARRSSTSRASSCARVTLRTSGLYVLASAATLAERTMAKTCP